MPKDQDKVRVGSTPNLRYTILDPRGKEVSLVSADTLELKFIAPSGGTNSLGAPALISGEVAVIDFQTLTTTFNAEGLWIVAFRATFPGSRVYESTVDEIHVDASRY